MTVQANSQIVDLAKKAPRDKLEEQIQVFRDDQFVRRLLDAIPSLLAVLNSHRQIIYANRSLIDMLEVDGESSLLGQRPGDVFECVHVFDSADGCGSGELCQSCGALVAILSGEKRIEECRMTRLRESRIQAHELQVTTTPFEYAGETFTIFSIEDKSAEHRRQMLERIFFHDIMNIVGSIKGFAELLELHEQEDKEKLYLQIREAAEQVIGEVETQRVLSDAEHGRLELKREFCSATDILQRVVRLYDQHKTKVLRHLNISENSENHYLVTDQSLLMRILGNMVVNALEAISPGETVSLSCRLENKEVVFSVHNPGEIPAAVKPEIFRRTYSTKGAGRGLGTYSMRLLSHFLQGEVLFTSDAELGTTFYLRLAQNLEYGDKAE
jgi:signal transduction histidine kinase